MGQWHLSQLQNMGAAETAEERPAPAQLPSCGGRLQEGGFDAEQSPRPTPCTGILGLDFVTKFTDCLDRQLGLPGAAETNKERQDPLEEGTLATERNLGDASAYNQDNDHRPKPSCSQDFSTLFLRSATTGLWNCGVASAQQHV